MKKIIIFTCSLIMFMFTCIFMLTSCGSNTNTNDDDIEGVALTVYYTFYNQETGELVETSNKKPDDIGNVSETRKYDYNTYVDLYARVNDGYIFVGWYNEGQLLSNEIDYKYMLWDEDFTIEARFQYVSYNLMVFSNDSNLGQVMIRKGNSQTFYDQESSQKYYKESITIAAYSKGDTRFLGWYNENNELVSTNAVYTFDMVSRDYTLEAKWDYFTITYDLDGGVNNVNNPTCYSVASANISLKEPTKVGYTFKGWEYKNSVINEIKTANSCNMELKALWAANNDTPYKVEHYLQNIDNNGYTLYETDNLTGTTDTLTAAEVKTYEYFTPPTFNQVNISGDGNTVIKLYYARDSYSLTLEKNINNAGNVLGDGTYKYGKKVTITASTNQGYTFDGWYEGNKLITQDLQYTFTMQAKYLLYTAKWTANTNTSYKVEHYKQNIDNGYTLNETDNLTGTTGSFTSAKVKKYEGFTSSTFNQVNISGDGSTVVRIYYTRNTYILTLDKNINKAGEISGGETYKYGKSVTITASTNPGYTFDGWYAGDKLLTNNLQYTFTMQASNLNYTAKWTANKYTITIDNQVEGINISGITSGNQYSCDSQIIITAENVPTGYTIKWTRSDKEVYAGNKYTLTVPAYDMTLTTTVRPYEKEGNKIYFGTYPQTKVNDSDLIYALGSKAGRLPTSSNTYNWTAYNYYISGNVTNYMYYIDIDYDDNGTYDYRGVYFTSYRPYSFIMDSSINSTLQYGNGYSINKIYWFSYDPIEWEILEESKGKALVVAKLLLDSQDYYQGISNSYESSSIRTWLKNTFYKTAFNSLQKKLIDYTAVDNSVASTGQTENEYVCNTTYDYIFLLSYAEVEKYTTKTGRIAKGTDYAISQGLCIESSTGYGYWWTRSPSTYGKSLAYRIGIDGYIYGGNRSSVGSNMYISNSVDNNTTGIRPACWIIL